MICDHKQFRCTNNVFYCLVCGAEIANPYMADKPTGQEEKPAEAPKKPVKRKRSETK